MSRMAASNGFRPLPPHLWVFTTRTDPLLTDSMGKPFLSKAKSLYTLPVEIPVA